MNGSEGALANPALASGRYELGEQIAAGGMGVIHRAYDRLAQREVAYKRLLVSDERSRVRLTTLFQREYDTLLGLPHPNIVEVYDYGQDLVGPYYAMELLSGQDLTRSAPLPVREACRIVRDVASALALVHARRMVHRDVSPNNVRLTSDGRAKLIDFGALTPFGKPKELVGTPAFTAPECLSDHELDQRSDLYSLGALAYWALTRRLAVRARSIDELLEALHEPALAPSLHVPEIPRELDALVLSLLASDPLARPPSAAHVIDRLTAIADLPPEADERRVAHSYLARPPLAGRGELMHRLDASTARLAAGHGHVLLVAASAGLGRSAVLDAVAVRAQLAGLTVLRVRGDRNAGPFALARKLSEIGLTLYPDLRETIAARKSFQSAHLSPKAQSAVEVAERHAQVLASVQAALLEISRRNPLLIVADDLHASDHESLALLASLAQEVEHNALGLLVSSLGDAGANESPAHAKLAASATRYELSPLREEQVIELIHSLFGGVPNSHRLAQWLYAQSGGNPATCLDFARLLLSRGVVRYTLGTFTLPHDVDLDLSSEDLSRASLARLGDLGADARALACLLSLHEGELSPEQLASAAELSAREVLLALEVLSGRGVVAQGVRGFGFTGSSLRAALERTLVPEQRRALHHSLARALLAHPDGSLDARFAASTHLLNSGRQREAVELIAELGHCGLSGETAARWVPLIEAVLAAYKLQGRSKELSLALLIPLMHAGFYGQLEAQRRYAEEALSSMSLVCGMSLAGRVRRWLGGPLALALGMLYALVRRALTPKRQRLGSLQEMLAEFVGLVTAVTAAAVSSFETAAAFRFNRWLEPLSALPKHTPGYLLREFCMATAEVAAGQFAAASARYAHLIPALSKPVRGLDEHLRRTILRGCLNARAQAEAQTPHALALADQLDDGDPFFAPHAECARMGYYAYRGEVDTAEIHRARGELLALRGGVSWSAVTLLTARRAYLGVMTRDPICLVQAAAELERLSGLAPKLRILKTFCEAWLEFVRGRPERALALYEQVIDGEDARLLPSWRADRAHYAALLNAAGQHARAKQECLALLGGGAKEGAEELRDLLYFARQHLAMAEAGLGQLELAAELSERHIAATLALDNPLLLGDAHHDRATIALMARDRSAFDRHFAEMQRCFRATRNATLIQRCDALFAKALAAGLHVAASAARPGPELADDAEGPTVVELDEAVGSTEVGSGEPEPTSTHLRSIRR